MNENYYLRHKDLLRNKVNNMLKSITSRESEFNG